MLFKWIILFNYIHTQLYQTFTARLTISYFIIFFNLRITDKLNCTQMKLYTNENQKIARITFTEIADEVIGPNTGNSNTYKGKQIPKNKNTVFTAATTILFCKCRSPHPNPKPSTPVVNGKINSSVGSNVNNSKIVNP